MHNSVIHFAGEELSNTIRDTIHEVEPESLRTFTPSQAVLAKSAGCFHWTPEGRRLFDYSSGVLVANLGHNPARWMKRFAEYLGWTAETFSNEAEGEYIPGVTLTAYNAITPIEADATRRLLASLQASPGGSRMQSVMWAASGSEAVQKAIWCCLHRNPGRNMILATRHGFHGKKGMAGAVTGSEKDPERDPRVRFISFPMTEIDDQEKVHEGLDLTHYETELNQIAAELDGKIACLITEPYLGGGGSFHPPAAYLQLLERFCRQHDIMLILDEVQANFGRTGRMYAFEKYGIEPDLVCLGKGLGNGVPVSATAGRRDLMDTLSFGATSDTWSANPIGCAAVLATLDEFEQTDVLQRAGMLSDQFLQGLRRLKSTGLITHVRGEGMVFGIECAPAGDLTANQVAIEIVRACYEGEPQGDGIHLLGALAGKVLRVSPPMTITTDEARESLELMYRIVDRLARQLSAAQPVPDAQPAES